MGRSRWGHRGFLGFFLGFFFGFFGVFLAGKWSHTCIYKSIGIDAGFSPCHVCLAVWQVTCNGTTDGKLQTFYSHQSRFNGSVFTQLRTDSKAFWMTQGQQVAAAGVAEGNGGAAQNFVLHAHPLNPSRVMIQTPAGAFLAASANGLLTANTQVGWGVGGWGLGPHPHRNDSTSSYYCWGVVEWMCTLEVLFRVETLCSPPPS